MTEAPVNWRTVWPGEWTCDNAGYIWADSLKGGRTHMIDVRGWGYLTGCGMSELDLDRETAERLQNELGALLCAAPDLLAALQSLVANLAEGDFISETRIDAARAAIARATGEAA